MPDKTILYTRTGDEGYTSLLGQEKVPKYDLRPEAYGTVDEATSFMGLVRADETASERTKWLILEAQRDLWVLMGELAAAPDAQLPRRVTVERVAWLEAETDKLSPEIPPLKQFVLPGDTPVSAQLDVARTIVRRAERCAVRLLHEGHLENGEVVRYLNRLSSLLFALARYEEYLAGHKTTLTK
jgi:cob(I)alamin adenosyltransferase